MYYAFIHKAVNLKDNKRDIPYHNLEYLSHFEL